MLERRPEHRWASMSSLIATLQELESGFIPDVVREYADEHYDSKLRNNRVFFHLFYKHLFDSCDEIGQLFEGRKVTMEDQYRKLDRAMGSILSFNRRLKATTLDPQIESHSEFGLKREYFQFFGDAFLAALREAQATDEYSREAWSALINPALAYMSDKICSSQHELQDQCGVNR